MTREAQISLLRAELELLDKLLWAKARELAVKRIPYRLDEEYTKKSAEYERKKRMLEEIEAGCSVDNEK